MTNDQFELAEQIKVTNILRALYQKSLTESPEEERMVWIHIRNVCRQYKIDVDRVTDDAVYEEYLATIILNQ